MTQIADDRLKALRKLGHRLDEQMKQLESLNKEFKSFFQAGEGEGRQYNKTSTRGLLEAIKSRKVARVQKFLKEGADPNARTTDGEPILQLAVSSINNEKMVQALLDGGSDVNARDLDGNTALIVCANDDRIRTSQLLIEHGGDVNAKNDAGDTPLTNAACWGSAKTAALLLKHDADPTIREGQGLTALSLARQHGHQAITKALEKAIRAMSIA